MPFIEKPISISNNPQYPSNGSLVLEVNVEEFLNACSQEERDWLKQQLNQEQPQIRPLTEEEVKEFGLDKLEPTPTPPAKSIKKAKMKVEK